MIGRLNYFSVVPKHPRWWHVRWWLWLVGPVCAATVPALLQVASWWRDPPFSKSGSVLNELQATTPYMEGYLIDNGRYPGPGIGEVDKAANGYLSREDQCVDLWGKKLVYWVSADGRHAMIYSCGPNGIDEHGLGDDIAVHFDAAPPPTASAPSTQPP